MDSAFTYFRRAIQNERGSLLIFVIMTFFIVLMLMASIMNQENTSIQQNAAVTRVAQQKADFANYIYTMFTTASLCTDSTIGLQLSTNSFVGGGTFTIGVPGTPGGLAPGTNYPDPASGAVSYLTICPDATAPCTQAGMYYVPSATAAPPAQDFYIVYKFFDPTVGQLSTNQLMLTVQYTIAGGAGPYTLASCTVVNTSQAACNSFGLVWCPNQQRSEFCEAGFGCWNATSATGGSCSLSPPVCPTPTPGVGAPYPC